MVPRPKTHPTPTSTPAQSDIPSFLRASRDCPATPQLFRLALTQRELHGTGLLAHLEHEWRANSATEELERERAAAAAAAVAAAAPAAGGAGGGGGNGGGGRRRQSSSSRH